MRFVFVEVLLGHIWPVHLLGKTACLQLEDTVFSNVFSGIQNRALIRICFEMTRQFTKTRCREDEQAKSIAIISLSLEVYYGSAVC
jgi:hypothetical protein